MHEGVKQGAVSGNAETAIYNTAIIRNEAKLLLRQARMLWISGPSPSFRAIVWASQRVQLPGSRPEGGVVWFGTSGSKITAGEPVILGVAAGGEGAVSIPSSVFEGDDSALYELLNNNFAFIFSTIFTKKAP